MDLRLFFFLLRAVHKYAALRVAVRVAVRCCVVRVFTSAAQQRIAQLSLETRSAAMHSNAQRSVCVNGPLCFPFQVCFS